MKKRTLNAILAVATDTVSEAVKLSGANIFVKIAHNLTTASGSHYVDLYPEVTFDGTTWLRLTTPTVQIALTGAGTKLMQLTNLPPAIKFRIAIVKTGSPVGNITSIEFGY